MRIRSLWCGLALSLAAGGTLAAGGPYTVTFVIDMREEIAAKRFDPAKDWVGIRSGVAPLAWNETLPARDADGDGRYEVKVSFRDRPFGGQPVTYKFKVDSPGAGFDEGWEDGKNRLLFLTEPTQTVARRFNDPGPPIQPVRTGTIRAHPGFTSKFLGPRDVIVYLPPGYDKETSRRYPVLYMHDGQNVFDASSAGMEWQMDETAEKLIGSGQIEPVIVVGVSSTGARTDEYTHTTMEWKQPDGSVIKGGGKADLYGRLLIEELKPFIDRTYRTRPEPKSTGLGGASLGGLVSLYLGLKHPNVFGNILAVSPSVQWDQYVFLETVKALPAKTGQRIWVDMGTREGEPALTGAHRLNEALQAKGWKPGVDLRYFEQEGAGHDEIAWASRVEGMLRFLYGKAD